MEGVSVIKLSNKEVRIYFNCFLGNINEQNVEFSQIGNNKYTDILDL